MVDWENIDPYSSLGENNDTQDSPSSHSDTKDLPIPDPQQATETNSSIIGTVYFMQERKTVRHSTKPLRANRNLVNYSQMDCTTDSSSPKQPKKKPAVPSEPSAARISVQQIISNTPGPSKPSPAPANPSNQKRFNRKDPSQVKPVQRNSHKRQEDYMDADTKDAPDPSTIEPQPTPAPQPVNNPKPKPEGAFKSTSHSLVKQKLPLYFHCPVCHIHKTMVLKLNMHFKLRHPPLHCGTCNATFYIPSTLSHHKYSHEPPRHKCKDCDKSFYFTGELKQHRPTHFKIRMHVCSYGKCKKSFMHRPDLLKHVRTHTNLPKSSDQCDYTTRDARLFKNHQKLHTEELPFSCELCSRKFKHCNQLRRHTMTRKGCIKHSDSPMY